MDSKFAEAPSPQRDDHDLAMIARYGGLASQAYGGHLPPHYAHEVMVRWMDTAPELPFDAFMTAYELPSVAPTPPRLMVLPSKSLVIKTPLAEVARHLPAA